MRKIGMLILPMALVLGLTFSLAGCGGSDCSEEGAQKIATEAEARKWMEDCMSEEEIREFEQQVEDAWDSLW